ncbi:MAG: GAF domain-containing protein [Candidatus Korobacteraceae bacterium]
MKFFVCGTYADLTRERKAVFDSIEKLRHEYGAMEFFGARPNLPIETVLAEVRQSDILVVIVGSLYGSIPLGRDVSFTEAEYEEGFRLGKPCLVYLRHENVPIEPRFVERRPRCVRLLEQFKSTLQSRHVIATFRKPSDLALKVEQDLTRLLVERATEASAIFAVRTPSSSSLWMSALYSGLRETLNAMSNSVAEYLRAETCSIFLVAEEEPQCLKLISQGGQSQPSPLIPIQSVNKGGLTGHIADKGELFNDHGPALRNNPYVTGKPPQHLRSERCFSLLAVPIKDSKGRLLGLLKVENKTATKDPLVRGKSSDHAEPDDDVYFTEADETLARILANEIVLTFETLRITKTSQTLLRKLNESPTVEEFFQAVLIQVQRLTGADRGDIIWWNEESESLNLGATIPEGKLKTGDPMPERSIANKVIESGLPELISNVAGVENYFACNDRTVSEVVLPVRHGNPPKTLGALNAEWFKAAGFDGQDVETLKHLADFVALGANLIESRDRGQAAAFRDLQLVIGNLQKQESPVGVLQQVLYALVSSHFDRARIFKYIPEDEAFECLDSMGVEEAGTFKQHIIKASSSKYAKFTLENWQDNPSAAIRDPRNPRMFGADPHAVALRKPREMPWAVAPLVMMGRLYGYIAADNSRTRRPILAKDLARMDLFSTLTAQLISNLLKLPQKV